MRSLVWLCTAIVVVTFMTHQCADDTTRSRACKKGGTPSWLSGIIADMQRSGLKGQIIQYEYKDEYVFLIDHCRGCADTMSTIYNCDKEEICRFGGIAGYNTCPDFNEMAKKKSVVWGN